MSKEELSSLTYAASGVDTHKAQEIVADIAALRERTETKRKLFQPFGLFAASYDLSDYDEPVMFTACDGVGTKIRLLYDYDKLHAAGVDLVAMSVNDILCCNAMPLVFLDYIGINKIDQPRINKIIEGLADSLAACDCILAGGETAEMPGMVHDDMIELSGFCVGAAEKRDLIDMTNVAEGDRIIGIPSSGFHANGWSLVRKIFTTFEDDFSDDDKIACLDPTRIYYPEVKALNEAGIKIHSMAHITGGGFHENLERVLNGHGADITLPYWDNAAVQKVISKIELDAAVHAFNMGIGYVFVLNDADATKALELLSDAVDIGTIAGSEIKVTIQDA